MTFRDRIRDLRRVRAGDLVANPKNWRRHPQAQLDALRGVLAEVGYADALLVRELPDGRLALIDGQARAELDPEQQVPVLVVDVSDAEAAKLLATLDPITAMAEADDAALAALLSEIDTESEALKTMLAGLSEADAEPAIADSGLPAIPPASLDPQSPPDPEPFALLVHCGNEGDQLELYAHLRGLGYECVLMAPCQRPDQQPATQQRIIELVGQFPGATAAFLASRLELAPSTVVSVCRRAVSAGTIVSRGRGDLRAFYPVSSSAPPKKPRRKSPRKKRETKEESDERNDTGAPC